MTAYAISRGIEYIYEECPFADGSQSIFYKESLNSAGNRAPRCKADLLSKFSGSQKKWEFVY